MPTKTAMTVKIPRFRYRGFDVPAIHMPAALTLIDDIGTGEPDKLAAKSSPLSWRVALYTVGRDLSLGVDGATSLPDPVKEAGWLVYEDCQAKRGRGVWHKDSAYILPRSEAPKGMLQPKDDDFVLARYFKDIEGFEQTDKGWKIKPSVNTDESLVWLPYGEGSFVVPTKDGAHNPVTGTPFETVRERKEALSRWVSSGLTEEQATKELSCFCRRYSSDVAAVFSQSGGGGAMCVSVYYLYGSRNDGLGAFPAKRGELNSELTRILRTTR